MIKAVYEAFACLFMKYSGEIVVTPPGLGKNLKPPAMPHLPNSTKEEMPMMQRRGLSSPATTASLPCTFPQACGTGHRWKQETEAAQPGSPCRTCHESRLQHEEAVTAADTEKKSKKTNLKNACTRAPLNSRD